MIENVSKKIPYIRHGATSSTVPVLTEAELAFQKSLLKLAEKLKAPGTRSVPQLATEATGWRAEILCDAVAQSDKQFLRKLDTKLASNHGFDAVTVYGAHIDRPVRVAITECKAALERPIKTDMLKESRIYNDGTRQMASKRIEMTIEKMLSPQSPAQTRATGYYLLKHWSKVELELYAFEQSTDKLYHLSLQSEKAAISTSWLDTMTKKYVGSAVPALDPFISKLTKSFESTWLVLHAGSELKALSDHNDGRRAQSYASLVTEYMQ